MPTDGDADDALVLPRGARLALLAPDAVVHRLAGREADPERRWLLAQPREVRASFVREVLDGPGDRRAQERWLLLQDDAVRRSFVAEVLDRR
jgi:hypothetical protein